ncbi:unnamed protein product [Pieris macdunnoughi]|uniref:Uncharacterized protein n=1 Tax=Pieris macdunnoughi TaxID=345717 RepID=A0A821XMA0_9NEOP|nr:unnamed protein product [Pieris macdunnoughi]
MREAQRAYNYNSDQQRFENWAFEPEPFDNERVRNKAPTKRSQNFRMNAKPQRAPAEEQTVVPSTTSTPMRDEPLYDMGPHSSLLATQDVYCQNFEYSGFIPIVNQTYEKLRGVDPRLHERLPLSMFTHAMASHLNLEILESARQSGQNVLNRRSDAREVLPDYQMSDDETETNVSMNVPSPLSQSSVVSSSRTQTRKTKAQVDNVLTKIAKKLEEPPQVKQQYDSFGEHIAEKLRNLPAMMATSLLNGRIVSGSLNALDNFIERNYVNKK